MTLTLPELRTFADYLGHYARTTPDADAVWHDGRVRSYRELDADVNAMAASLTAAGVRPGDRVAQLSAPRPEFLVALLAANRIGAVWVGLNPRYTSRELAHVIGNARPRVILSPAAIDDRDLAAEVAALADEFDVPGRFLVGPGSPSAKLPALPDPVPFTPAVVDPDSPATIVYTSGSSGAPKGAVLTHRGLVYASRVEANVLGIVAPRVPCNLPVNHVACLADLTGTTLIAGGMLALFETFDPGEMLQRIEELRLTNLMNVPTVLQYITLHPDFAVRDLSSLQFVVWGGAPLPVDVIRLFRARSVGLMAVYGMTETIASITFTGHGAGDEVLAETVGHPDPAIRVRLADAHDAPVEPGEQGEIQLQHAGLFTEYFGDPGATERAFTADGWFKSGDIGVFRPDGNLRLVGRLSDMIKSGGYNVYPREIELCLERHPAIALSAVIGRPDDTFGEVGTAYIVAHPGAHVDDETLRAFCREHLANYKVPKEFVIVDELPLLPVGKVDKPALRRRARDAAHAS
ncbi:MULTISPECIES: class I adenylate-forming enzyme family protein [unclassified Leucobacter]|uniref:class I adenylate-forming enzyme family protein n=1 Tax=unclassified Leucobacter TaxID=2621730 RepID=UPI00165EAB0B|nr:MULTISPECIES: AMP-binding protein [unclassified Leucobacter]MBC9926432.1 AMP-binding protein [Leucobacter sp. cx-169]